jgi:hypothetical protein
MDFDMELIMRGNSSRIFGSICIVLSQSELLTQGSLIRASGNSTGAEYVTLEMKIEGQKVKTCQFGSAKWFWLSILHSLHRLVKRRSKALTPSKKGVLNMI